MARIPPELAEWARDLQRRGLVAQDLIDELADDNPEAMLTTIIIDIHNSHPPDPELYAFLRELVTTAGIDVNAIHEVTDSIEDRDRTYTHLGGAADDLDVKQVEIFLAAGAHPEASYGEAMRVLLQKRPVFSAERAAEMPTITVMLLRAGFPVTMMRPAQIRYLFENSLWPLLRLPVTTRQQVLHLGGPMMVAESRALTTVGAGLDVALGPTLSRYVFRAI